MITQLKSPLYAQLELTASCNNSCNYCYNFWRSAGVKGVAEEAHPFSHFSAIIDELARNDVFQLTITGGEPLLKKEILLKTIERASKLGIDVSLNTNLTLLDDVMAQCLKDMGLKSVLGSLISHDKNTYNQISGTKNYASVLEGMDAVVRAGISLGVNMVVEKQNLGYVFDTARLCSERGVGHFFATRLNPSPAKKRAD